MMIQIEIQDDDLLGQKNRLIEFFNIESDEELKEKLQKIIPAALLEYIDMIVGKGFPSRAEDVRQYRLFFLIKYYYKRIPTESEVSEIFQETQTRSKSLIRLVLTRFRYELKEEIDNALKATICDAEPNNREEVTAYNVTIQSDILVEELNRLIDRKAPKRLRVKKITGTGRSFTISPDSYCKLRELICQDGNCPDCPDVECPQEEEDEND